MIRNFIKSGIRNLAKYKLHSFINIFGLSVGVAVCLLIIYFIVNEKSWDKLHSKADRIFRLNEIQDFPGTPVGKYAITMYPMGPALKEEYSQVESFTRFLPSSERLISNGDRKLIFKKAFWVDDSFLNIFDFPAAYGQLEGALTEPNTAILTESTAKKIFGDENVTGRTFLRDTVPFTVTAVLKDIPENSHLQFDALFSIVTVDESYRNDWGSNFLTTYILLKPGTSAAELEKQFPAFIQRHIDPKFVKNYALFLQPLLDLHLGSSDIGHDDSNYKSFNGKTISIFILLTIIILTIAFVNFINLSIAASSSRAKEVGIKKAIGAGKKNIAVQFIGETILLTILAFTIGLMLSFLALPLMNKLTDRAIEATYFLTVGNFLIFYSVAIVLGILAGLYPSFYMASFQTIQVLKGKFVHLHKNFSLRNILVTGQFAIAIVLIIATLLVSIQVKYLRNRDTGFNREQVIVMPVSNQALLQKEVLRNKLLSTKGVEDISFSGQRLGNTFHQGFTKFDVQGKGIQEGTTAFIRTDERYIPLYKLKIIKGENFKTTAGSVEDQQYIINESFATQLGWSDPIGKSFAQGGTDTKLGKIVGVVKDFNFNSLKTRIEPMVISNLPLYKEISIKLSPGDLSGTINKVKSVWNETVTDRPFEYTFLDDHFDKLYKTELQLSKVISIAAGLSVFIASLGILGLITIIIQQRTKEIGIRKLLGASVSTIVYLFSKRVIWLVVIASVVAFPVAWWAMNKWLEDFAYRIHIGWWVFVVAAIIAFSIAILTVSFQAIKAAIANPVKSLRSE